MTEALLRLGTTQWFVLVDVEKEEIIDKYFRPQVEKDILAMEETLKQYADPTIMEEDLQALIWLVNNYKDATAKRKERVIAMVQAMWQAYQDEPALYDGAQLRDRLERTKALLGKMV